MNSVYKQWALVSCVLLNISIGFLLLLPQNAQALNINEYRDTLSDSGPEELSNHTLDFILRSAVSPGGTIEITPPSGFTVLATSTFGIRNIELYVDGTPRTASSSVSPGVDMVEITTGSPGFFRYTLAPDFTIPLDSNLQLRIGNHTSLARLASISFSTTTGTTTVIADIEPIQNSLTLGVHEVNIEIYDGALVAKEEFVIFLNEKVNVPNVNTREEVPPERFSGAPSGMVGATTLSVEISLETNEFAICKFGRVFGTSYDDMPNRFSNTGLIFHTQIVSISPSSTNQYYVRCLDDEGNFNIDDYIISFEVGDIPTGIANPDGTIDGDGSGSGDEGSNSGGSGSGSGPGGGSSGSGSGPGSSGSGGSGFGGTDGGGGTGNESDSSAGGFETNDEAYQSGDARVIISGYAYPKSTVSILVDGNYFDKTNTNSSGVYSVTLDKIARGVYTFGVYAQGSDNIKSSTFSTSFTVTGARTSALSNVNVSPSVLVSPDPVDPGQTLTVSGYSLPNANITIQNGRINTDSSKEYLSVSDSSGRWSTIIDTTGFSVDTYQIQAKAEQIDGVSTNYSEYTFYGVGKEADVPLNADLNRDGKVNLIDFSILLFWWNGTGGDSDPPADINRDGNVSLTDFSILLFNWTG
jgi:hypothetical protein